jgi:hypothetical protein
MLNLFSFAMFVDKFSILSVFDISPRIFCLLRLLYKWDHPADLWIFVVCHRHLWQEEGTGGRPVWKAPSKERPYLCQRSIARCAASIVTTSSKQPAVSLSSVTHKLPPSLLVVCLLWPALPVSRLFVTRWRASSSPSTRLSLRQVLPYIFLLFLLRWCLVELLFFYFVISVLVICDSFHYYVSFNDLTTSALSQCLT